MIQTYVLGVVWKDPSAEKSYWYGPLYGENERWAGEAVLKELWRDKLESGIAELQFQRIGKFPWQDQPSNEQTWATSGKR